MIVNGALGQTLNVVRREQPPGEEGVRTSLLEVANFIKKGGVNAKVRAWALEQLERARRERGMRCKTDRERAEALHWAVQQKLWVPDPVGSEFMTGAHLMACDRSTPDEICFLSGDCFPEETLILKRGHELARVADLRVGDEIWGLGRWSAVRGVKYKGVLPVDVVELNNGSQVPLTSGHKVFVLDCEEHPMLDARLDDAGALPEDRAWRGGGAATRWGCSCGREIRQEKRTRVSELRPGMVLTCPDRIPFGEEEQDPDVAYIDGLYVSDGWVDNSRFCISGQDGCPKEEQKREVQAICDRLNVPTRWNRKYIAVNDADWALRMQLMGHRAPEKKLLSLNLGEGAAGAVLRGVMADSGKNTKGTERTFTTTSRLLATQTRVLHKMFGVACGYRFVPNHGGLGTNPIHRLGTRPRVASAAGRRMQSLRVRGIERCVAETPCWDIETDDHRVYLPEHDVTVSQCDDLVLLLGSCYLAVGLHTMVIGHAYNRDRNIEHVLLAVRVRKVGAMGTGPEAYDWLYSDPSTDLALGKCVRPFTRERFLSVPNVQVLCDANVCMNQEWDPIKNDFVVEGVYVGVSGPPMVRAPAFEFLGAGGDALAPPAFSWLGKPSTLGAEESPAARRAREEATAAANKKIDEGGGLTNEDAADVAGVAAAAAAAVICSEAGPLVAAGCATVAGEVTRFLTENLLDAIASFGQAGGYGSGPWAGSTYRLQLLSARLFTREDVQFLARTRYDDLFKRMGVDPASFNGTAQLVQSQLVADAYERAGAPITRDPSGYWTLQNAMPAAVRKRTDSAMAAMVGDAAAVRTERALSERPTSTSARRRGGGGLLVLAALGIGAGAIWWLTRG